MKHLKEGDTAPDIVTTDEDGKAWKLADKKGKKVILFFYPNDDTPTCTKEACNFRDNYGALKKKGFEVVGVSNNDQRSHKKFIKKYDLPFPLLMDEDKKIVTDYGVYGEKQFMGRIFDGIHRTTFIINEAGVIVKIIEKVKSAEATQQVLDVLAGE